MGKTVNIPQHSVEDKTFLLIHKNNSLLTYTYNYNDTSQILIHGLMYEFLIIKQVLWIKYY